jgi:alpha-1,3-glucan synthase
LGNLIGFGGFLNTSAPFTTAEHKVLWKSDRRYLDFNIGNKYNETCAYPRFYNESGGRVIKEFDANFGTLKGCYDSEFDQVY